MLTAEEKNVTTVTAGGVNRIELDTRIHLYLISEKTNSIIEETLHEVFENLKDESNEFNHLTRFKSAYLCISIFRLFVYIN